MGVYKKKRKKKLRKKNFLIKKQQGGAIDDSVVKAINTFWADDPRRALSILQGIQVGEKTIGGENRSLDPEATNKNRNGSTDSGLFQVNSDTFNDFKKRYPEELEAMGIKNFQDMKDPIKNSFLARLIYNEQGDNAYYGSPRNPRNEKRIRQEINKNVKKISNEAFGLDKVQKKQLGGGITGGLSGLFGSLESLLGSGGGAGGSLIGGLGNGIVGQAIGAATSALNQTPAGSIISGIGNNLGNLLQNIVGASANTAGGFLPDSVIEGNGIYGPSTGIVPQNLPTSPFRPNPYSNLFQSNYNVGNQPTPVTNAGNFQLPQFQPLVRPVAGNPSASTANPGTNTANIFDTFDQSVPFRDALSQITELNQGTGNIANFGSYLFSNLFGQQPVDRRTNLTNRSGTFGFKHGGGVQARIDNEKMTKSQRRKYRKLIKDHEKKVNEARTEVINKQAENVKEAAIDALNQQPFFSGLSAILPDLDLKRMQLGGLPLNNIPNPIAAITDQGGRTGALLDPRYAFTYSPLMPTQGQLQEKNRENMIQQLLSQVSVGQLGGQAASLAPEQEPTVPIDANGLFSGLRDVLVPSRDITFRGINVPTAIFPIPGMNMVLEKPLAEVNIVKEEFDRSPSDNKRKKRKKRRKYKQGNNKICKITLGNKRSLESVIRDDIKKGMK